MIQKVKDGFDIFHRFISSRKSINGSTMSDFKGKSVLEGTGAHSFRAVRRL